MFEFMSYPDYKNYSNNSFGDGLLLRSLREIRDAHGIEYITYAERDRRSADVPYRFVLTYRADWLLRYLTKSYFSIDPVVNLCFDQVSVIDWNEVGEMDRDVGAYLDDARSHGVGNQGITIPTTRDINLLTNVSFTFNATPDLWQAMKAQRLPEWRASAKLLQKKIDQLVHGTQPRINNDLTRREVSCLNWAALGKTDQEIARILETGVFTVHGHIRSARRKLGCANKTAAVARAIVLGILKLDDVVGDAAKITR